MYRSILLASTLVLGLNFTQFLTANSPSLNHTYTTLQQKLSTQEQQNLDACYQELINILNTHIDAMSSDLEKLKAKYPETFNCIKEEHGQDLVLSVQVN